MIHFLADSHFNHSKIIQYCNRPFKTVDEMNETIIKKWNDQVQPNDEVFHLGDVNFSKDFRPIRERLNGKIHLIRGNHDRNIDKSLFESVHNFYELKIAGNIIVLCHYALKIWNRSHHGALHLYGHSHGTLPEDDSFSFDVGVDTHDFRPWTINEVYDKMKTKKGYLIVDHHNEKTAK